LGARFVRESLDEAGFLDLKAVALDEQVVIITDLDVAACDEK